MTYFGVTLPDQVSVFQYFRLFPLDDKIYSAIFQCLVSFQGADWDRREGSQISSPCQLALTLGSARCLASAHQWFLPLPHSEPPQLCSPAVLSLCFLQSEGLSLSDDFSTGLSPPTVIPAGPSLEIRGTNRSFSYQNLLCRPLEYKFIHSAKSFTTLLSSLFSRN